MAVPRTDNMIGRLRKAQVFSMIDLKTGLQQVRVHPHDRERTAFTTKYGQFKYSVMATSVCNAPGMSQSLMNETFRDAIDDYLVLYMNDLHIYIQSAEKHLQHLELV